MARIPSLFIPVVTGAYLAYSGLAAASGYAAGYAFGGAWIISGATALGSLLLLPLTVTRRAGVLGLIAAASILVSFYVTFFVGYQLGLYDWWGDRLVPIKELGTLLVVTTPNRRQRRRRFGSSRHLQCEPSHRIKTGSLTSRYEPYRLWKACGASCFL